MRETIPAVGTTPKQRFPELYPMWLALYVDILGFYILVPLFPFIRVQYGLDAFTVSLLLATNAVFSLFFGPLLGSLSDKHGRTRLLSISLVGTTAGFVMLALSPDVTWIFLSRVVDGCFGGVYPITRAMVVDTVPPPQRARQMANMGIVHILASLVGPAIGGVLVTRTGTLVAPGLLAAGLSGVALAVCVFLVKEPRRAEVPDGPATTVHIPETRPRVEGTKRWMIGGKDTMLLLLQWGSHSLGFVMFNSLLGIYCDVHLALNPEMIGYLMALSGLLKIATRFTLFNVLISKLGETTTSLVGLALFIAAYAGMILVQDWPWLLIVLVAASLAASCTRGPLNSVLSQSVSRDVQGRVQGVANSIENVTQVVAPAAGGIALAAGGEWFSLLLALLSVPPLAMGFHPRLRRERGNITSPMPAGEAP